MKNLHNFVESSDGVTVPSTASFAGLSIADIKKGAMTGKPITVGTNAEDIRVNEPSSGTSVPKGTFHGFKLFK